MRCSRVADSEVRQKTRFNHELPNWPWEVRLFLLGAFQPRKKFVAGAPWILHSNLQDSRRLADHQIDIVQESQKICSQVVSCPHSQTERPRTHRLSSKVTQGRILYGVNGSIHELQLPPEPVLARFLARSGDVRILRQRRFPDKRYPSRRTDSH
jgi:hypothetical protein